MLKKNFRGGPSNTGGNGKGKTGKAGGKGVGKREGGLDVGRKGKGAGKEGQERMRGRRSPKQKLTTTPLIK